MTYRKNTLILSIIWFLITLIALFKESSHPPIDLGFTYIDKCVHFTLFFIQTILVLYIFKKIQKNIFILFSIALSLCIWAGLSEIFQKLFTRTRSAEFLDFIADLIGIAFAFYLYLRYNNKFI